MIRPTVYTPGEQEPAPTGEVLAGHHAGSRCREVIVSNGRTREAAFSRRFPLRAVGTKSFRATTAAQDTEVKPGSPAPTPERKGWRKT